MSLKTTLKFIFIHENEILSYNEFIIHMSLCKCESENEKRGGTETFFKNEYFSTSCEMKAWFCDDGVTLIPVLAHIKLIYIFFCSEKQKFYLFYLYL